MKFVWEHNGNDTLLYSIDCVGAYTRGETLDVAISKAKAEVREYTAWMKGISKIDCKIEIVQEKKSNLKISDADSDVLFDCEKKPLIYDEYVKLKCLALQSAKDFYSLYRSVPDLNVSCLDNRKTFYGNVPRTAQEMYDHTKNVNSYYFGEIGVDVDNSGTIYECRERGFAILEQTKGFLDGNVFEGSYGEAWSLRKVIRRFVWHDRIHAKAMYRMAVKTFGQKDILNPFKFNV